MNPYDVYEMPRTATDTELKKQFKVLAKKRHPDRGGSHEAMKELLKAKAMLEPERREATDLRLAQEEAEAAAKKKVDEAVLALKEQLQRKQTANGGPPPMVFTSIFEDAVAGLEGPFASMMKNGAKLAGITLDVLAAAQHQPQPVAAPARRRKRRR